MDRRELANLGVQGRQGAHHHRVNADDPVLRLNRLRLLAALRRTMAGVADFGRIAG